MLAISNVLHQVREGLKYYIQLGHNQNNFLCITCRFQLNIYIFGAGRILSLYSKISPNYTQ
jgi:hypothetical protein